MSIATYELSIEKTTAVRKKLCFISQANMLLKDLPLKLRKNIYCYRYSKLNHNQIAEVMEIIIGLQKEIALKHKILFIDANEVMSGNPFYLNDHIHLTQDGSEFLGKLIARKLYEFKVF